MKEVPEIEAKDARRSPAGQRRMAMMMAAYGGMIVRGAIPATQIEAVRQQLDTQLPPAKRGRKAMIGKTLDVGNGRFLTSIPIEEATAHKSVIANATLVPLLAKLLGSDFVLGAFNLVEAQPGAGQQHFHKDHRSLFNDQAIDNKNPPYAIAVSIPLVAMNRKSGTNRLALGSHLVPEPQAKKLPLSYPNLAPGDVLLTDYRIWHGGTANKSGGARPVAFAIYYRSWFQDITNHASQPEIIIARDQYAKLRGVSKMMLRRLAHQAREEKKARFIFR